jgi:uncharacterized membrane protein YoaK (UPF0700 family)
MTTSFSQLRSVFYPGPDDPHGPLQPMLLAMTLGTGLVDAFSYLVLGHVFVANMTGNILFLAFALAGAPGLSISASIVALLAFVAGAAVGGKIDSLGASNRGRMLANSAIAQATLMAAALVIAIVCASNVTTGYRYTLIIVLAIALGIQNATSRKLAVPDLTTTVLTLTIVGIGADSTLVGGTGSRVSRRMVAVITMFLGAFISALLVLHAQIYDPLIIALVGVVAVGITGAVLGKSNPKWAVR